MPCFETAHSKEIRDIFFETADSMEVSGEMKGHGRGSDMRYIIRLLVSLFAKGFRRAQRFDAQRKQEWLCYRGPK